MNTILNRKIKNKIYAKSHSVRILCPTRMIDTCVQEINSIIQNLFREQKEDPTIEVLESAIYIKNLDYRNILQLTLESKTIRDILWKISQKTVKSRVDLIKEISRIEWQLFLPPTSCIAIRATSRNSQIYHEGLIKSVVSDQLTKVGYVVKPQQSADFLVDLRIENNQLITSLSMSGGQLFKRGFKENLAGVATVKEDLAACATAWCIDFISSRGVSFHNEQINIVNPFAGSGTLGFEAALHLGKVPNSILGRTYACEKFVCTPLASLNFIRAKLAQRQPNHSNIDLCFGEISPEQCSALEINAAAFCKLMPNLLATKPPRVIQTDVLNTNDWMGNAIGNLFLIMNPPFGMRLKLKAPVSFYRKLGEWTSEVALQSWSHVGGYSFAPDKLTHDSFLRGLGQNCSTKSIDVIHGGKKIKLIAFIFKRL